MGKTVTTECAFLSPGKTRNPWNPLHTPGGSSSGSAAAVAAGFVPAALGTQTNGSVIRPAAFCGVVGFKPTQGLIPIEGALTFSHTLDQPGIFTRSVEDAAWLAAALADDGANLSPAIAARSAPPRLAAVRTPVWDQAEEHAKQNFGENIQTLRKGGARVEEVELPEIFNLAHRAIRTIMAVEAALNLEELYLKQAPSAEPDPEGFHRRGTGHGGGGLSAGPEAAPRPEGRAGTVPGRIRRPHHPSHDGRGAGDAGADGQSLLLLHLEPLRRPGRHDPGGIRSPGAAAGIADRGAAGKG